MTITTGGEWRAGTATTPHPSLLRVTLGGPNKRIQLLGSGSLLLFGPVPAQPFVALASGVCRSTIVGQHASS